ncbi:hypothetical protein [Caloranaerobacter sp. DY30410]|uniref:hypothetical protein n=1 Tax=Caloranaerobacter sp. DY30410 TaxID=3238305 RepID=UPI003CFDCB7F
MILKQLNIWGEEVEVKEIRRKGRRYKTMQELYGYTEGKICKTCKYLMRIDYHGKRYYKCQQWFVSKSAATDIRLKNKACGKYEESEGK